MLRRRLRHFKRDISQRSKRRLFFECLFDRLFKAQSANYEKRIKKAAQYRLGCLMSRIKLDFRIDQSDPRGFGFKIFMINLTRKPADWVGLNLRILMGCQACQDIID